MRRIKLWTRRETNQRFNEKARTLVSLFSSNLSFVHIYIYTRGERKMKRELSIVRSLPHRFPCLDALKPDIPRQMLRGSKW